MLTQRRGALLRFLVNEYIDTAEAVGSGTLVKRHGLTVSPATVRHEMATLEDEGYITRSHSSAGGIPLEKGYRYYLEATPSQGGLPPNMKRFIRHRLSREERDVEAWVHGAAEALAEMVTNIAVATSPGLPQSRFRHLELVHLEQTLILLVVVLDEGILRKEFIPTNEALDQDMLTRVARKLNHRLVGLTGVEISATTMELLPFESHVKHRTVDILHRHDEQRTSDYYIYGLRHLLRQPEFAAANNAQTAVEVIEDRALLGGVFSQPQQGNSVRVVIGRENPQGALHSFSVVLCRYDLPGGSTGTLGVIGPTRMDYHRTIAAVAYISSLISQLLAENPVE
jgi:heat-inducible transcriptional repressor